MTFATLQDAWGIPTFQAEPEHSFARPPRRRPHPRVQFAAPRSRVAKAAAPAGRLRGERHATLRRQIRALVAREGVRGLAAVLGRDMVRELCALTTQAAVSLDGLLADPERVLAVLIGAFVLLLLADTLRSA